MMNRHGMAQVAALTAALAPWSAVSAGCADLVTHRRSRAKQLFHTAHTAHIAPPSPTV